MPIHFASTAGDGKCSPRPAAGDVVRKVLAPLGVTTIGYPAIDDCEIAFQRENELRFRIVGEDRDVELLLDPAGESQPVADAVDFECDRFGELMAEIVDLVLSGKCSCGKAASFE